MTSNDIDEDSSDQVEIINLKEQTPVNFDDLDQKTKNSKYGDIIWPRDLLENESSKEKIYKIESQIIKNNEEFTRFPSDYLHALLSYAVYRPGINKGQKLNEILKDDNQNLNDWEVYEVFAKPAKDEKIAKKGSIYTGVLFINHTKNQMVLSHRGIEASWLSMFKEESSLDMTINGILLNNTVPQMAICYEITQNVIKIANDKKYFLSYTGYSNGAWLAEYSIYYSHKHLNFYETKAVLFESPGIIKKEADLNSNIISYDTDLELRNMFIVNYLLSPNLLNTSNSHIGTVYRLFLDDKDKKEEEFLMLVDKIPLDFVKDKLKKSKFLLQGFCSMFYHSNLKSIIKKFDSKTGRPIYSEHMLNWPKLEIDFDKNFQDNFKNTFIDKPLGYIVDNIPYAKLLPDLITDIGKGILKKGCELIFDNLVKCGAPGVHLLINVIVEICNGNMDLSYLDNELFYKKLKEIDDIKVKEDYIEYNYVSSENEAEKEKKKKGFIKRVVNYIFKKSEKQKTNEEQKKSLDKKFNLIQSYEPSCVINQTKMLKIDNTNMNIDWCLLKLQSNFEFLVKNKKNLSSLIFSQLKNLKSKYKIKQELIKNNQLSTAYFVFVNDESLTVELLKEKLIRFIKLYPKIKNLIDDIQLKTLVYENQKKHTNDYLSRDITGQYIKNMDFASLNDKLLKENKKTVIIYGPPGAGKSTFVSQFSRYFTSHNSDGEYFCISFVIGKIEYKNSKKISKKLKKLANNSNFYLCVLDDLIYDPDNDREIFKEYIMNTIIKNLPNNVYLVFTSRARNGEFLKEFDDKLEMKFFEKMEAEKFFKQALKEKYGRIESIMNKFKDTKEFLPLKLSKIASYINQKEDKTIDEAVEDITSEDIDISKLIFDELFKDNKAKLILNIIAFTHNKKLTFDFIFKLSKFENKDQVESGLNKLRSNSIIFQSYDSQDNKIYFNIHDEIQKELINYIVSKKSREEVLSYLYSAIGENLNWKTVFTLNELDHLIKILSYGSLDSSQMCSAFNELSERVKILGNGFFKNEKYEDTIEYYFKYFDLVKIRNREKTPDTYIMYKIYHIFESCYDKLNNKAEAEKYQKLKESLGKLDLEDDDFDSIEESPEILELIRLNENLNDESLANIIINVGDEYKSMGELDEAVKYYEKSIEIYFTMYPSGMVNNWLTQKNLHPMIKILYNNIKECDSDNMVIREIEENTEHPLNQKYLNFKAQSKACIIS